MTWRERGALRIREAADVCSISETKLREGIASGEVETVEILGQRRVPVSWVLRKLGETEAPAAEPDAEAMADMLELVS